MRAVSLPASVSRLMSWVTLQANACSPRQSFVDSGAVLEVQHWNLTSFRVPITIYDIYVCTIYLCTAGIH